MTFLYKIFYFHAVLLAITCAGCIGQRNAVKTQTELRAATKMAMATAHSLKESADAELQAHKQTRDTLIDVTDRWKKSRISEATMPVIKARDAALLNLQTMFSRSIEELQIARHNANVNLSDVIEKQQGPLAELVKSVKQTADEAAAKAANYPDDKDFALASTNAQLTYVSIAAKVNTEELRTRIRIVATLDQTETKYTDKLRGAVETQQAVIQTAFDQAINSVKATVLPEVNIGPDPTANTVALDGLIKYFEAVDVATMATEDYLQSNSLGKGSFFYGALKAFGKGIFTALPVVGSGKGATLQEVKDSGGTLLQAVQDQFKQTTQSATDTARSALKETLDDAKASIHNLIEGDLGLSRSPETPN